MLNFQSANVWLGELATWPKLLTQCPSSIDVASIGCVGRDAKCAGALAAWRGIGGFAQQTLAARVKAIANTRLLGLDIRASRAPAPMVNKYDEPDG